MAFIDEVTITAEAGLGGNGVVRWRREKFIDKGGPNGGDGGKGGNVYALAVRDIYALMRYRNERDFHAPDGLRGMGVSKHGKSGEELVLQFPIGTIITNKNTGKKYSLLEEGQKVLLLEGGDGGFGNEHFKSSTNVTPTTATDGKKGEAAEFEIELELFADVGLIGFPNAGKSSLLNVITNAKAKVGDYAFTTLDPNLGVLHGYVLADIPGLIEGASEGKGLGTKFLRHIKRTKMLAHLVSFENAKLSSAKGMLDAYKTVRKELSQYDKSLPEKDEVIILTKTDTVEDKKLIEKAKKEFEKLGKPVYVLSLYDDASIKQFADEFIKLLRK